MKTNNKKQKKGYNVLIIGNICYRCGYEWVSKDRSKKPDVCAKCRSPYWYKPKERGNKVKKLGVKKNE